MKISFVVAAALSLFTLGACSPKADSEKDAGAAGTPATEAAQSGTADTPQSSTQATKVSLYQAEDELLLEALDASDYPIVADLFKGTMGEKPYCPDTNECSEYVVKRWDSEMKEEPLRQNLDIAMRKSYLESLQGQAPHIQQEITKKAFATRYAKLKELIEAKNVCFLYSPWKLEFLNDKYHLSGGNGVHTAVRINLLSSRNFEASVLGGEDTYIISDDKFFAPIPALIFGDSNYKKFAAYSEKSAEERPVLKFCGKPMGDYNSYISKLKIANTPVKKFDPMAPPEAPPEMPEILRLTNLIKISKPIELVQPPKMQKIDTIPLEWFVAVP